MAKETTPPKEPPKYRYIVQGTNLKHDCETYPEGSVIELTKKDAKALSPYVRPEGEPPPDDADSGNQD